MLKHSNAQMHKHSNAQMLKFATIFFTNTSDLLQLNKFIHPLPECSNAQMLQHSNAQTLKCTNAKMLKHSNAQMHKCTNAQTLKCTNVQMHKCTNAPTLKCSNAQLLKHTNAQFIFTHPRKSSEFSGALPHSTGSSLRCFQYEIRPGAHVATTMSPFGKRIASWGCKCCKSASKTDTFTTDSTWEMRKTRSIVSA